MLEGRRVFLRQHGAVFEGGAVGIEHRKATIERRRAEGHLRADGACGRGVRAEIPVPKGRASHRAPVVVVRRRESPVGLGRADVGREDNVGVEHQGKCRIVIAHVKPHDLSIERVADLHAFEGAIHVLVGVRRAQPGFAGFPELNPNAAVLLAFEGHALVTDGHLGWVGPGLHHPIFFPPWTRHVGAVARRTGSHPQVDAGPHVVQFEAGLRHKAFRPLRRVLALVNAHTVTGFRHGFMDRLRRRAFPGHAPSVADQIA